MSDLLTHRQSLRQAFRACLPEAIEVFEHPGRFGIEDVNTYAHKAPCVGIAILSADQVDDRTDPIARTECAAYILTKSTASGSFDETGLYLASVVQSILHGQGYSAGPAHDDDAQRPNRIAFQNLHSAATRALGVWLGAVSWRQLIELEVPVNADGLSDFVRLSVDWNFAPVGPFEPANASDLLVLQNPPLLSAPEAAS